MNQAGWRSEWLSPLRDKTFISAWDVHTGFGRGIVASIKRLVVRLHLPLELRGFIPSLAESPVVPAMARRSSWEIRYSCIWFHNGRSFAIFILTVKFSAQYQMFGWKCQYCVTSEWSSASCNRWSSTHISVMSHPPKILDIKCAPWEGRWWKNWYVWKGFTWRKITLKSFFIHTCPRYSKLSWIPESCNSDITKGRVPGKMNTWFYLEWGALHWH